MTTTLTQPMLFAGDEPMGPPRKYPRNCPRVGPRKSPRAVDDRQQLPRARFCVLGSGSGGNASVLNHQGQTLLIDAGFGIVTTRRRLEQAGLTLNDIRAVVLTHLDQDHFRPRWLGRLCDAGVPLWVHRWHAQRLERAPDAQPLIDAGLLRLFDEQPFEPLPHVRAHPIRVQHDEQGTSGFRIEIGPCQLGYATDLGHVPPALIDHFAGVDLLAIESNYDPMMQMSSSRPFFLKRRIMNGSGHLSNQQAFDAVTEIAARSPIGRPHHVVLLHRSRDCNHPAKIRKLFADHPTLARRLVLADQRRRSRWIPIRPAPAAARAQALLF